MMDAGVSDALSECYTALLQTSPTRTQRALLAVLADLVGRTRAIESKHRK